MVVMENERKRRVDCIQSDQLFGDKCKLDSQWTQFSLIAVNL